MQTLKTGIEITESQKEKLVKLLNQNLANLADLYSQTKQAHWNVKGDHFIALHKFYDDLAADLPGFVDALAERITAIGGVASGTVRIAAKQSQLDEFPNQPVQGHESLDLLYRRYSNAANTLREAISKAEENNDPVTEDLFTAITGVIDKKVYFIQAHIQ